MVKAVQKCVKEYGKEEEYGNGEKIEYESDATII